MKLSKTSWIILIAFIGLIGFFINAVIQKETTLKEGKLVLLKLAPVDPRSLMQGDYMDLRYAIASITCNDCDESGEIKGYVLLQLDKNGVGSLVKKTQEIKPASDTIAYIKYYDDNGGFFRIGAESYFFQEGEAEKFEKAVFGGLRIDDKGNSVLVGLYNDKFELIK